MDSRAHKRAEKDSFSDELGADMAPRKGDFVGRFLIHQSSGLRKEANDKFES